MELVTSLIPNDEHMVSATQALEKAGFARNKISILFQPSDVWQQLGGRQKVWAVTKKAGIGALIGLFVGALYGIPAGVLNCKFMNCSLETSIIMWALISLFWVIGGAILGAVVGLDKLDYDLYSYMQGVGRGEALVIVETSEEQVEAAEQILRQAHGTVIHDTGKEAEAI